MISKPHRKSVQKVLATAFAAAALLLSGCDSAVLTCQTDCSTEAPSNENEGENETEIVNLFQTAVNDGNFTTLVAALEQSGLYEVLSNEGASYTVFAPTDDAFAALGQDNVDALLTDNARLSDILLYHVLPGAVDASTARELAAANTAVTMENGGGATLSLSGDDLLINTARVTITDMVATNGVIHVIDAVLDPADPGPPATTDLMSVLVDQPNYSQLLSYLQSTGLNATLADTSKQFTVFAPTNAAFAAAESAIQAGFAGDESGLQNLLLGHVVPDSAVDAASAIALDGQSVTMANGATRTITVVDDTVKLDGATVVETDISASNGIIHGIDAVLMP